MESTDVADVILNTDIHPADIEVLPPRQKRVLEEIVKFIQEFGYPPSIHQLCKRCGVSSTSTIHYHVSALKKKGFIHWNPSEKRAISVRSDLIDSPGGNRGQLPMLGTIAAGHPLQTLQDAVESIHLAEDLCPPGCYALRVRGFSMVDDHIVDGDIIVVNPRSIFQDGDVVVALVENQSATLKRIYREKDRIRLQPANATMEPIYVSPAEVQVQGKVEAIIRRLD